MQTIIIIVVMVFSLITMGSADNAFKEGGKEVGQGFRKMGKDTGRAVKEGEGKRSARASRK